MSDDEPKKRLSRLSLAAISLGVGSFNIFGAEHGGGSTLTIASSLSAVVAGVLATRSVRASKGRTCGEGAASVGILLGARPRILASDRDAGAIAAAKTNAERAGVADMIEFSVRTVSAVEPPAGPGVLAANPPYGERVSAGKELKDLYAAFGRMARTLCAGWELVVLAPPGPLVRSAGLRLEPALSTLNGGLSVRLRRGRA